MSKIPKNIMGLPWFQLKTVVDSEAPERFKQSKVNFRLLLKKITFTPTPLIIHLTSHVQPITFLKQDSLNGSKKFHLLSLNQEKLNLLITHLKFYRI